MNSTLRPRGRDPNHNLLYSPHHLSAYPYPEEDSPGVDPHRYVNLVQFAQVRANQSPGVVLA